MQFGTCTRSAIRCVCSPTRVVICALLLATAHEGTTGLCAAAAPESPRVAGSRSPHLRRRRTRSYPVHARWRFHDAHVRLSLPPVALGPYRQVRRFSSADVQPFAPQLLNVLLTKIGVQQSPERTAENDFLMRCACAFRALQAVPDKFLSQVLRESSSRRSRRSSGNTSPFCRGSSTSFAKSPQTRVTPTLINTFSKAYPVLFDSLALLCQTRSLFSNLRFFLLLQKSCKRT